MKPVLLKLKVLLCAGEKKNNLNFSVFSVCCGVAIFMILLLGSFCEVFKTLRSWENSVPLTLDGKSMLL